MTAAYNIVTASRASDIIFRLATIRSGGTWVIPANICLVVPIVLACAGAKIKFVDICPDTLCLDAEKVARVIQEESISGIIYVRTYGYNGRVDQDLSRLKKACGGSCILVDDQCMSLPLTQGAETDADVTLFSTGFGKVLDLGGGGYAFVKKTVIADSKPIALNSQRLEALMSKVKAAQRFQNADLTKFDFSQYCLSKDIETSPTNWGEYSNNIARALPNILRHKAEINDIYAQGLTRFNGPGQQYSVWRHHILLSNPDEIIAALFESNLYASRHYPALSGLWKQDACLHAKNLGERVVNLFNDEHFTVSQAQRAVTIIDDLGIV